MGVFTGDAFWGNAAALRFSGVSRVLCRRAASQAAKMLWGYALTVAGADVAPDVEQIACLPTRISPRSETGIINVVAIGTGQAC